MTERFDRIRELVLAARERSPEERATWLRDACGGDEALRAEVESLLAHDESDDDRLHTGGAVPDVPLADPDVKPATNVGPYRIVGKLGEGGFGEVWEAEQSEPVRRVVALKILKPGMDSRAVLARFEAERHALSRMEHPNVARILDAGRTESGRPYFVMERIHGRPITQDADARRLDVRARVAQLAFVCEAVEHAHRKGILHRDIKPSNVLMTEVDGRTIPKVIDFGIAKAIREPLTDDPQATVLGQVIGTPAYMSPEQAAGSVDLDVGTDVYSLGAVLYELLAGAPPFEDDRLRRAGSEGLPRILREEDPPPPSSRAPQARAADTRGELDWITARAMAKEPERRYSSARELAEDLRRFLAGDAVEAAPPGAAYQARKFLRRHRLGVGIAVATLAVVLAFAATMAIQARRIAAERDRAERVAEFLADMLETADPNTLGGALWSDVRERVRHAREEEGGTEAQVDAALRDFDAVTRGVNPTDAALRLLDEELLARAADTIARELADDPRTAAQLRGTLGKTYRELGLLERAEPHLRSALAQHEERFGPDDMRTIHALNALVVLLQKQERIEEAAPLARAALERARRAGGDSALETLSALTNLGRQRSREGDMDGGVEVRRRAVEAHRRVLGSDHRETIVAIGNLGLALHEAGRGDEAEPLLRESADRARRALGPDSPTTLTALNNLALLLQNRSDLDACIDVQREVLEASERVRGDRHPDTIAAAINLAGSLDLAGRLDEAESRFRDAIDRARQALGEDHTLTITALGNFGAMLTYAKRYEDAEAPLREALNGNRRTLGPDHFRTIAVQSNLGDLLRRRGEPERAAPLLEDAIARMEAVLPPGHWYRGALLQKSGACLAALGQYPQAEEQLLRAHELLESTFGAEADRTRAVAGDLLSLYSDWNQPERARAWKAPPDPESGP